MSHLIMPYNLQYFAADGSSVQGGTAGSTDAGNTTSLDSAGLSALLNTMGNDGANTQGEDTSGQGDANGGTPQESDQTQQQQQQQSGADINAQTQQQKDAGAFAAMRVRNKQMENMLKRVADAAGIQYANTDDMLMKLNDDALGKLAEKQGVPKELLMRLDSLEKSNQEYRQEQVNIKLRNDFMALQEKYNLTPEQLQTFATQLSNDRVDPLSADIMREYEVRNFDAIVQQRIQDAVQTALSKDQQVDEHSSTPNAAQGSSASGSDAGVTCKNSAELHQLLATLK